MTESLALYTDGSARPNPGYAGWGVHGYLFTNEKPKKGSGHRTHLLTSFGYRAKLDGLAKENEVTPIKYFDLSGSIPAPATNNTAELKACIEALKIAIGNPVKVVTIYSDSKMVVEGTKGWIKKWKTNGWIKADGGPLGSKELWQEIDALKTALESNGTKVNMEWVKGHGDNPGNILADKLAVVGTLRSLRREGKIQSDTKEANGYWKEEVDKHPLLDFSALFFNTLSGYNTPGLYYLSNKDKEEDFIGSAQPDTAYAVVKLKQPDEIIEYLRNRQSEVADKGQRDLLVLCRLTALFKPTIYTDIVEYGDSVLERPKDRWDFLHVTNKEPVTRVLNPPRIAMRAVEDLSWLAGKLDEYESGSDKLTITDLTHHFYDENIVVKKKEQIKSQKLKEEYVVGFAKKEFDVNYNTAKNIKTTKVILSFGIDIVSRNALKRIEDKEPSIQLITWMESDLMFRYATIIKTKDDISIWSASHSNLKLISI